MWGRSWDLVQRVIDLAPINWSSLFYSSRLLLWLSISGAVLYAGMMIVLSVVAQNDAPIYERSLISTLLSSKSSTAKRRVNRWAPLIGMFIVGFVIGQASLLSPVRELHNVEVLSHDGDRAYTVMIPHSPNPDVLHDVTMTIRFCSTGDDLPLEAGMVIDVFQYIQERDCLLINSKTNDEWHRDSQRTVVGKDGKVLFAKE